MISLHMEKTFAPGRTGEGFHLNVQLDLPSGKASIVLFGASGSGKTLTLQCLAGLARPDNGSIAVNAATRAAAFRKLLLFIGILPIRFQGMRGISTIPARASLLG